MNDNGQSKIETGGHPMSVKPMPISSGSLHFTKGLLAWFSERFPAAHWFSGLLMYFVVASVATRVLVLPFEVSAFQHLGGSLSLIGFFLLLRIIDEHKDFTKDLIAFPDRVLQSGQIQLVDLRYLAALVLLYQFAFGVWLDQGFGPVGYGWVALVLISLLMSKEFYIEALLKKSMLIYSMVHLALGPLLAVWILSMNRIPIQALVENSLLPWLLALIFFAGLAFEFSRKSFGAEEEKPTQESYSLRYGSKKCALFIGLWLALFSFSFLKLQLALSESTGLWMGLMSLCLLTAAFASLIKYGKNPTRKNRKINEALAGLVLLSGYTALIWVSLR